MERIAWALIRCRLRFELSIELRICLETLWALPAPNTPFDVTLSPASVLVGLDGTVELAVPYPADQRYFHRYLAPELARSETPTVASAIYAVGGLLFEAVSGSPFESSTTVEREVGYLAARAEATGLRPDATDSRLLEIAARATRENPHERWATPELFSREIDRVANHRMATREELASLVLGWVQKSGRWRRDPTTTLRRRASMFPPPLSVEAVSARRHQPVMPRSDAAEQLRISTLRGYSLDLSSYPPPRPQRWNEPVSPASVPPPIASTSAAPAPSARESSVPFAESALGRPTDHRSAALITALIVAIPLVGLTLWNWHASAHAARRALPAAASASERVQRARATASLSPPPSASESPEPPRSDLSERAPLSEAAPAERRTPKRPQFKQRGPDDYGI